MWQLGGTVVGPRGTMPIVLYLYDQEGSEVLCTDLQGKNFYSLNLSFGYLRVANRNQQAAVLMAKGAQYSSYDHAVTWMNYDTRKAEKFIGVTLDKENWLEGNHLIIENMSQEVIQVLVCLVSRQVSGDEILKGLRVRGIKVSGKLQMNYLGGWTYIVDDKQCHIGSFLYDVILAQLGN